MSDNENKTEDPSEKRLEEARSQGQIAKAPELQVVAGLIATFSVILFAGKNTAIRVAELWAGMFGHLHEVQISSERIGDWTKISMLTNPPRSSDLNVSAQTKRKITSMSNATNSSA